MPSFQYHRLFIIIGLIGVLLIASFPALAVEFDPDNQIKDSTKLPDPEGGPEGVVVKIIQWSLGGLGLFAVIMVIWGGYGWMMAAGNEEKIKKAKAILSYAIIGLIIILLAWAMVSFVFNTINDVTV